MKIKIQVSNSLVETKKYTDIKTGNVRERVIATIGGLTDQGEMVSCVIYGSVLDDFKALPKSGFIMVDAYKYESVNSMMGNIVARSFTTTR